jgi:flagellar basal body rod protein FlgG
MKKLSFVSVFLLVICGLLFSQEINRELLLDEFSILIIDLSNTQTIAYKRHVVDIENKRSITDFSQGSLIKTDRPFDFSIIGNGFFKIITTGGRTAYTRAGEFTVDTITNRIMTIDGYFLYDNIIIYPGFSRVYIDNNNILIAEYPNGENITCGQIKVYELNATELYRDEIPIKPFEEMFPDFLERTGDMVVGIKRTGKNDTVIYFYKGDEERLSESIIVNNYLENSNVDFFEVYLRLFEIIKLLN